MNAAEDQTHTIIIVGDFNLDENHKNDTNYSRHRYYNLLQNRFNELRLIQLIKFNTWSRLVNGTLKELCLDHLYTNDSTVLHNISQFTPLVEDHKIITAKLSGNKNELIMMTINIC